MIQEKAINYVHPMGEKILEQKSGRIWPVDTPGGRYYAEADLDMPVTREGQLIFFAQFLKTGGRWEEFLKKCPLQYESNRGSSVVDVMGTAVLSILCGHWRYAHINAVRGDTLNPELLAMNRTVSEDVVRRAMKKMSENGDFEWLKKELQASVEPILSQPWILDIDATIKSIYGHQQEAEIGYNPHKPGRPSHCYHSYFVANTRLCLGVEVLGGKQTAGSHGLPGLWERLDRLPRTHWPTILRGDCSYGNEALLSEAESRGVPCLLKLRKSEKVKSLIQRMDRNNMRWKNAGDGWEVMEGKLKLAGWSKERRVVLVRPKANHRIELKDSGQLPGSEEWELVSAPWQGTISVLVTTLDEFNYPSESIARLYRERADAENIYDELKNQWGWNGFTTREIAPSRLMANLIALIYNWWSLYARLYNPQHHSEAIVSRPALLNGVARLIRHAGQSTVKVSLQHENSDLLIKAITTVSNMLQRINAIAEQWTSQERWAYLLTLIFGHWLGGKWLSGVPIQAERLLSG